MSRANREREDVKYDSETFDVRLVDDKDYILLDNGILQLTLTKPGGGVSKIAYAGLDNLLDISYKENSRGYWDINWSLPEEEEDTYELLQGSEYNIVDQSADKIEVSFLHVYDVNSASISVPLNVDIRFSLLRGHYGFYTYAIYEHSAGWVDFDINQTRLVFRLLQDGFRFMAVADNKQRLMPSAEDRNPKNSIQLAYPEAVLLTNPTDPTLQGEVDDKFQYSCDNRENLVHGWISFDPVIGFWMITPSNEFRNGGILKQNLTSHVGPVCLSMFHSNHYAGSQLNCKFRDVEAWKKTFGPVLIYLNSELQGSSTSDLWNDAKQQMGYELQSWPYDWPNSQDYVKASQRGEVLGILSVQDRFASTALVPARSAFLGLASPGSTGSWQTESKGYQFWSQADENGNFIIRNILPGDYELYGWVSGVLGDYKRDGIITILPGLSLDLGDLIFEPPRDGTTAWEIGVPDRTASEFYIPDPGPAYVNRLFLDHPERYRQYGLWLRYSELFPDEDLVYEIGVSEWPSDWYFIHGVRVNDDGSLGPTTWEVRFQLESVKQSGPYKLRIAFAAAHIAAIQVRFNDATMFTPNFDTMQFGEDNAIARHGIHGLYYLYNVDVAPEWLREGKNSLFLTQRKTSSIFSGVMYDYLRLEEPA